MQAPRRLRINRSRRRRISRCLQPDYSRITELPAQHLTRMEMAMLVARYAWAAQHCAGKKVLEVGCGPGLGLAALRSMLHA